MRQLMSLKLFDRFENACASVWVFLFIFISTPYVWAAPPAENILLIYYADTSGQKCADGTTSPSSVGDTYPQQLESAFSTALTPISASVQTLQIHNGDVGISS